MDVESVALLLNTRSEIIELRVKNEEVKFLRAAHEVNVNEIKTLTADLAVAKRDLETQKAKFQQQIATQASDNAALKRDRDADKALTTRLEKEVLEHHEGRKRLRTSYRILLEYIGQGCDQKPKEALDSLRDHLKL